MATSEMVRLRNGSVEYVTIVEACSERLRKLTKDMNIRQIAMFRSLVMRCRNPLFEIDLTVEYLLIEGEYLCSDGQPHEIFRNIVLASAQDVDGVIRYVDPIDN